MVYGYCRVSTKGQLDGNSIEEQTNTIQAVYADAEIIVESYSGAKERPLFNQLLDKAQENDYVIVTKLDRFCRSTKEGLNYIDRLMSKGVKIHILNMGLIENTPMGRLIVTNLLAFEEFESKNKNRGEAENNFLGGEMMDIFRKLGEIKNLSPGSEEAQSLVKNLQDFITNHYYTCTDEILSGLGKMYVGDERFKKNIDKAGGAGTAEFAAKAIEIYCIK